MENMNFLYTGDFTLSERDEIYFGLDGGILIVPEKDESFVYINEDGVLTGPKNDLELKLSSKGMLEAMVFNGGSINPIPRRNFPPHLKRLVGEVYLKCYNEYKRRKLQRN